VAIRHRGSILWPYVIDLNTLDFTSCNCKFLNNATHGTSATALWPAGTAARSTCDRYMMIHIRSDKSTGEPAGCYNLEGGGLNQSQISGFVYVVICFRLRYASKPASPSSLPKPLLFTPPQGAW
jgi:hypothetical protein